MSARPLTLTIAALGGQGGGVVQGWLIRVAEAAGWLVQATSVPGVAQRTGATIYYLEFHARPADGEPVPVMALMPSPGVCDLVVAAELAEAVRMVDRGIVDTTVTTLIASSHRAYTIDEKSHLADGRVDSAELIDAARRHARALHLLDMDAIARRHGSVVSAALLGAIAATGVLPFAVNRFEDAITAEGKGVTASLAAFREAYAAVREPGSEAVSAVPAVLAQDGRLRDFPTALHGVLAPALARLVDYQDEAYASDFLRRVQPFVSIDAELAREVARGLALWMTFEDPIRVAQLKTAPERLLPLMAAQGNSLAHVTDYLKPRPEEIFGTLPKSVGEWARRTAWVRRVLQPFTRGQRIRSSSPAGYLFFRALARLQPLRRSMLRYAEEWEEIERWLATLSQFAATNVALAREVAACHDLVAGYGETREQGLARFHQLLALADAWQHRNDAATRIARLRRAALEDADGRPFDDVVRSFETEAEAA
ncbi:MAG: indolepyruvate oxidoreductase subunit beta family protein [Pseudomonadales bacterium]